jgi:hypothetical protein
MTTLATYLMLLFGLGLGWWALAQSGTPASRQTAGGCLFGLALAVWTALPFAGLGWAARRWRALPRARVALLAGALLLGLARLHFWSRGALSDLTFLFLPAWESIAVVLFVVVGVGAGGRER